MWSACISWDMCEICENEIYKVHALSGKCEMHMFN